MPSQSIEIALIQPDTLWEDIPGNLDNLDNLFGSVKSGTNLVILPETFSTGFSMNVHACADDGKVREWMQNRSSEYGWNITGSAITREEQGFYNRMQWITPYPDYFLWYDKKHLFRMGREEKNFLPGNRRVIAQTGGVRVLLQICYDIRFPVFSRNRNDYDLIIYIANWPEARQHVWDTLLAARALENQAYVIGVNRVGTDGEGVSYVGGSCAIDPKGQRLASLDEPKEGILHVSLDINELRRFRSSFPVWKDADSFTMPGVD